LRFIKQYGERRTGTNFVRLLLRLNFPDTNVLMHVLGDKHSAPAPLDEIWKTVRERPEAAWDFVHGATFAAPAESTTPEDKLLLQEIRRLAQPIAEAFAGGDLRYVVSVREPYAWIVSLSRYLGWTRGLERIPLERNDEIRRHCGIFSARHRAWLELMQRGPELALLARHEDLLADTEPFLQEMASRWGYVRVEHPPEPPRQLVDAAHWDYSDLKVYRMDLPKQSYLRKEYLRAIPQPVLEVMAESIDWKLMEHFGYAPIR
jgi:hypothetical protein